MRLNSFTTIVLLASLSGLASAAAVSPKPPSNAPAHAGAPKEGKSSPNTHSKSEHNAGNAPSGKGSSHPGSSAQGKSATPALYGKEHVHGGPTTCPGGTKVKHACCCG
jgi:hypothetical protein